MGPSDLFDEITKIRLSIYQPQPLAVATDLRVVLDSTEQGTCFRSLSLRASLPSSLRPVRARTKQVNRKITSSLIDYIEFILESCA